MLALLALCQALATEHVLAIAPFSANTSNAELAPVTAGLSDMLTTDIGEAPDVTLVERSRLQDLLAELALQQSDWADPSSAVQLGKGLGATHVVVGGLAEARGRVRLDARVVDVGSGRVVASVEKEGAVGQVFHLERQLALAVLEAIGAEISPDHRLRLGELDPTQGVSGAGFAEDGARVVLREDRVVRTVLPGHVFVDGQHVGALRFKSTLDLGLKPGRHEFAVAEQKKAKKPIYECWGVIDVPASGMTKSLVELCDQLLAGPSPYGTVLPPGHGMIEFSMPEDGTVTVSAGRQRVRSSWIYPFPEGDLVVVVRRRVDLVAPEPAKASKHPAAQPQSGEVCRKTAIVPRYGKLVFTATEQRCTLTVAPLLTIDGSAPRGPMVRPTRPR
ncbi:MAG: hypothetical protein H6737_06990 [Alphaproteobacteria bacterium]|nr:hypothetical protein [Alphaproteobacteria bacterium]